MNIRHLILREIWYRKGNFLLAVLAVLVSVGCLVGALTVLRVYDQTTTQLMADMEQRTQQRLAEQETQTKIRLAAFHKSTSDRLEREIRDFKNKLAQAKSDHQQRLQRYEKEHAKAMKAIEDDYRKKMRSVRFTLLIFPAKEKRSEMIARGYVKETMPESHVHTLANPPMRPLLLASTIAALSQPFGNDVAPRTATIFHGKYHSAIMSVNHLLPVLQQMVLWKEKERTVLVAGISKEVPLAHKKRKKDFLVPIPKGQMALGWELHRNLKLKRGDKVKFLGREFTVGRLNPKGGVDSKDDITVWLHLNDAQELLGKKDSISFIHAVDCLCMSLDRLGTVRKEVMSILPKTQVEEYEKGAVARAESRKLAKAVAKRELARNLKRSQAERDQKKKENEAMILQKAVDAAAAIEQEEFEAKQTLAQERKDAAATLAHERDSRAEIRSQITLVAFLLIPLALLGSIVWLGLMTLNNVHQRQAEIGILRALGLAAPNIYILFVTRAVVVGLFGALLGYAFGAGFAMLWGHDVQAYFAGDMLFQTMLLAGVLLAAPAVCAVVGWVAALVAARHDPAEILQQA